MSEHKYLTPEELSILGSCRPTSPIAIAVHCILSDLDALRAELKAAQDRIAELEKDKARLMEIAEYVAETLPKRSVHADEPSSLPMFQAWVSESMVLHARDILAAMNRTAQEQKNG